MKYVYFLFLFLPGMAYAMGYQLLPWDINLDASNITSGIINNNRYNMTYLNFTTTIINNITNNFTTVNNFTYEYNITNNFTTINNISQDLTPENNNITLLWSNASNQEGKIYDINTALTSIVYNASSLGITSGTLNYGDVDSIKYYHDELNISVQEVTGVNPLIVDVNFTGVTNFNQIFLNEYYYGSNSHNIEVGLWNYDTSSWEYEYFTFIGQTGYIKSAIQVLDTSSHISGGNVRLRFNHIQNGVSSHILYIDAVMLLKGFSGITSNSDYQQITNLWSNASNQEARISGIIIPTLTPENNNITNLWSNASNHDGRIVTLENNVTSIQTTYVNNVYTNGSYTGLVKINNKIGILGCPIGQYMVSDGPLSGYSCGNDANIGNLPENNNLTFTKNNLSLAIYNISLLWANASSQEGRITSISSPNLGQPFILLNATYIATNTSINFGLLRVGYSLVLTSINGGTGGITFYASNNENDLVSNTHFYIWPFGSGISRYAVWDEGGYGDIIYTMHSTDGGEGRLYKINATHPNYARDFHIQNSNGNVSFYIYGGGNTIYPVETNTYNLGSTSYGWKTIYAYTHIDLNNTDSDILKVAKAKENKTASQLLKVVKGLDTENKNSIKELYPITFFICVDGSEVRYDTDCLGKIKNVCLPDKEINNMTVKGECHIETGVKATGRNAGAWEALYKEAYDELDTRLSIIETKLKL